MDDNHNENNLLLIGVSGRKGSGKDTIGDYLVKNYGFVRVAFADALKKACKHIFGLTNKQLYDDKSKEIVDEYWGHSPREILQKVGTELFRVHLPELCEFIDEGIWIRSVDRKIKNLQKLGHTRIVITDVRFDNELDYVKNMGGYIWKVSRSSILKLNDDDTHASEKLIDGFGCDVEYTNDGTIDELYEAVNSVILDL
jgi:dephospho-CoA kinase